MCEKRGKKSPKCAFMGLKHSLKFKYMLKTLNFFMHNKNTLICSQVKFELDQLLIVTLSAHCIQCDTATIFRHQGDLTIQATDLKHSSMIIYRRYIYSYLVQYEAVQSHHFQITGQNM